MRSQLPHSLLQRGAEGDKGLNWQGIGVGSELDRNIGTFHRLRKAQKNSSLRYTSKRSEVYAYFRPNAVIVKSRD